MHRSLFCLLLVFSLSTVACSRKESPPAPANETPQVVNIVARGMTFDMPDEIPAGWTRFRFHNASSMIHFALVEKMPDGKGVADQQKWVAPVFQEGMNLLNQGLPEEAGAAFGQLPAWFADIQMIGGPGFVSPGGITEMTMTLSPGTYIIECYIKTGGVFHSFNPAPDVYGMVREFKVVDQNADGVEPVATAEVSISAQAGIKAAASLPAGDQVVAVHFLDQQAHENFLGHDVQLVALTAETNQARLQTWMDWREKTGLEDPSPAIFLGGVNELPAGSTAYLHVNLKPGNYAWISEVPGAISKGMFKPFEVIPK